MEVFSKDWLSSKHLELLHCTAETTNNKLYDKNIAVTIAVNMNYAIKTL